MLITMNSTTIPQTMNSTSVFDNLMTVEKLNEVEVKTRMPAIIFLSILIVVGITGNSLVWFIYGIKIRKQSTHKSLVLGIAFYDILACCVGMPGNIADLRNPLMFNNSFGCKVLRFGYHILAAGSTSTHLLMGIDRYRRICIPHSVQMSHTFVVYMLCLTFIVANIIASPTLAFYESVEVPTKVLGISGKQCSQSESTKESVIFLLYEVFLGLLVFVTVTCLIVFYSLIGQKICKREAVIISGTNHSVRSIELPSMDQSTSDETSDNKDNKDDNSVIETEVEIEHSCNNISAESKDSIGNPIALESINIKALAQSDVKTEVIEEYKDDVVNIAREMQKRRISIRNAKSRKLTLITFILMLIFIVSYCPVVILSIIYNTNRTIIENLGYSERCTYFVFLVSYTVTNVSNPLVYLAIDDEFRTKLRTCCTKRAR